MDLPAAKSRVNWTMVAAGVAFAYAVFLAAMFTGHFWLRDATGHIQANDFIDVFAAGKLASAGHAAQAYDWNIHRAAEVTVAHGNFSGYYGWHYPPPLLFVAVALSCLPYFIAFFLWIAVTLPPFAVVIARIAEKREAALWALAFPAVPLNAYVGQNGFLTAALFGAMLLTLKERPVLSGILVGLLTYKPQFGVLIPVALIAGGHGRAFLAASATAALLVLMSFAVFGSQSWIAFLHSVPHTTDMILAGGHAGWNKLQTVYGFARWIGASDSTAWIWQISVAALAASAIFFVWRPETPFALKAAALCAGTLLVTPYAYIYDFPLLAVAIAFLYRHRAFDIWETTALLCVAVLIAIFPWVSIPLGLAATLLVAGLVSLRTKQLALRKADIALQRA